MDCQNEVTLYHQSTCLPVYLSTCLPVYCSTSPYLGILKSHSIDHLYTYYQQLIMQYIFITLLIFSLISLSNAQQRVGIGLNAPAAKLDIRSVYSNPTIPGTTSTGVLRIGVSDIEAIDIGKMGLFPFAGWIQSGFNNSVPDPLLIQPLGGAVAIGNSNPAQSAAFEVTSTSKGLLPPRMTLLNRMSITNPAEGLVVWCTDCGIYGQMQVFNGVIWTDMAGHKAHTTPVIGDHDGV